MRHLVKDKTIKAELKKVFSGYDFGGANSHRAKAKERFYRRLKEQSHLVDKEMAFRDPQLLEDLAGTTKVHKWLEDVEFAAWWWDEHSVADDLMALRHKAVSKLRGLLDDEEVAASEVLKAIRLVFEVTDQFPSKKQEVRFLDKELDAMPDNLVDAEIKQLQAKLEGDSGENSDN